MYALVKFFDNIQYVCNSENITVKNDVIKVKYSDGHTYPANIIAKNDNKTLLEEILQNIRKGLPYIMYNTYERVNTRSMEKARINVTHKNATIYTTASQNSDCYNKSINSVDDDRIKNKIDTQNDDCDHRENTVDVPIIYNYNEPIDCVEENKNGNKTYVHNNYDYLGEAYIPLHDIKMLNSTAENENNIRMHTQDKDDVYQENSDVLISLQNTHDSSQNINIEIINDVNAYDTTAITTENNNIRIADVFSLSNLQNKFDPSTAQNCIKKSSFSNVDNNHGDSEESEYVPSESEDTSSDNNERVHKELPVRNSASLQSSLDTSKINGIGASSCNDEAMYVNRNNVKSKQNCCVYCLKLQSKLPRHLVTWHRDEPEVQKFAILPKKHKERKKIISILRKRGNFIFNTDKNVNTGQLIVCRRPNVTSTKTATDFVACSECKGFFTKNAIRHHSRNCQKKTFTKNKCIMIMGRRVMSRLHDLANETLKIVFPVMRDDEVTRIIRYDELLVIYGNKLCTKYKASHQHDMVRARLRLLGRFLLALKKIDKDVKDFQSIYHPKLYDHCVSAINIVAGYNNERQMYKTPATASLLSTLIKQIGNIFIVECIKKKDAEKKKLVEDFLKLLTVNIGINVNKTVIDTQAAQKRHKKVILPSLEDINSLYKYLKKTRTEAYMALQKHFSYSKWLTLAEVTLTSIHVFNRRRPGEIERILIEDFETYEKVNKDMHSDIYNTLSTEDRKIAKNYVRFYICGKLGRVPVLLSNELVQCVTLILKWREEAHVPSKNRYIFGLPSFDKHRFKYLRACALLRKFAKKCNARSSTTLRGTVLRKQATYCIQLNLNEVQVPEWTTFMDNADKMRKQHYRQPQASKSILKISQYLEAIQGDASDTNNESSSDSEVENNSFNSDINSRNISNEKDVPSCVAEASTLYKKKDIEDNNKKRKKSVSPYLKIKRVRWTEEEKEVTLKAFAKHIENLTLPSLKEIEEMKRKHTVLIHRTSPQIKTWLHNKQKTYIKNKR